MLLAIDIGNTNVVCGVNQKDKWIKQIRIQSDMAFWQRFQQLSKYEITNAAISSVVPKLTDIYCEAVNNLFHVDSFIITHKNAGIQLEVESAVEVGTDRICNVAAANELVGTPAIIGDIGSATNYDVVDEKGAFIGGAIAPGLETAARNLFEKAALLKETAFTVPDSAIGKDTATNLQSGIMLGAIDVIDGMLKRIKDESGWKKPHNIITGGFGAQISPHLKTKHTLLPNLTLEGIRLIYEKHLK